MYPQNPQFKVDFGAIRVLQIRGFARSRGESSGLYRYCGGAVE